MNIKIIAVGKIKEGYIKEGIKEFSKRLSRYCKLTMVEVNDEKTPERLSEREMQVIKDREGERILKKIPDNSYVISLAIEGKKLDSVELSDKISKLMVKGSSNVTFIIGGSLGLSDKIINRSNFQISFSKMTFPHQLTRLILLEQVYRGFRIIKGEPYHK